MLWLGILAVGSAAVCEAAKGFSKPVSTFKYTGSTVKGVVGPALSVPSSIPYPDYAYDGKPKHNPKRFPWEISPQTPEDIVRMRTAGRIAREVLDEAVRATKPGIATSEIDKIVHEATINRNSYPSPLNYHGFPKSCCTSVNEIICHGIPDSTVLKVNCKFHSFHLHVSYAGG